jgi:hypothetical protein
MRVAITLLFLSVALLISCKSAENEAAPSERQPQEIYKEYEHGPARLRLALNKASITVAESFELTITAICSEDFRVELPQPGEKLGDLSVSGYRDFPPRLSALREITRQRVYILEPFLPGDYLVPAMKASFRKEIPGERRQGADDEYNIETEEVVVRVHSLLRENYEQSNIFSIFGPAELRDESLHWRYILLGVLLVAIGGGAIFLQLHRRKCEPMMNIGALLPHEPAHFQLQAVLDGNLLEQGKVNEFFSAVSDAIRHFIANRLEMHAAALTTQELLTLISGNSLISTGYQEFLRESLTLCDLVRFAQWAPTSDEIQSFISKCRILIETARSESLLREGVQT